jgi:outer membrane protein OmpA-like peptidoglycan-associated protein
VKYLESKGISSSRLSAVGRGAANPKKSKAESRRVEIIILDR